MNNAKLFVKSLNFNTTTESLMSYFSKFGEVSHANVVMDRLTGRSRGFGFVTFQSPDIMKKILEDPQHEIDGRPVIISEAVERDAFQRNSAFGSNAGGLNRNSAFGNSMRPSFQKRPFRNDEDGDF